MPTDISNALTQLGLKESEIAVYLVCLKNRQGLFVAEVAKLTGIKRSSVNLILERLIQKGFVSYHLDGARKLFNAEEPEALLFRFEEVLKDFRSLIPLFKAVSGTYEKTKVRFFEGRENVGEIFGDILQTMKLIRDPRKEVLGFTSGNDIFHFVPEHQKQFIDKRVKARLPIRIIASDDKVSRELARKGAQELRKMRFFDPKKYPFKMEMNIYGDSIAFVSLDDRLSGVIVENKVLSSSFRGLFNLLWDSLK